MKVLAGCQTEAFISSATCRVFRKSCKPDAFYNSPLFQSYRKQDQFQSKRLLHSLGGYATPHFLMTEKTGLMAHTITNKNKLIARVRRIRGQIDAIEKALDNEKDCSDILQTVASCRGALNGLMCELIEGHVVSHVIDPKRKPSAEQIKAADTLLDVIRAYLK